MGSARRVLGRAPARLRPDAGSYNARLARVISHGVRLGKQIQLHQLGGVPKNDPERRLLTNYLEQIRAFRERGTSTRKLDILRAKVSVLRTVNQVRNQVGGRNPTVYQVLALEALRSGLSSEALTTLARRMSNTNRYHSHEATWEGNAIHPHQCLAFFPPRRQINLPTAIERHLFGTREAVDSQSIARALNMNWNVRNQNLINASMQLLETSKLIRKLPFSNLNHGQLGVWVHASYPNSIIRYPNNQLELLLKVLDGPKPLYELQKQRIRRWTRGDPNARISEHGVSNQIKQLKRLGLIRIKKRSHRVPMRWGKTRAVLYTEISISKAGRKLMGQYRRENRLPEALRKLLIGEKS